VFDGGWWFWPHGPLFWLLVIVLIGVAVAWFSRTTATRQNSATVAERRSSGLDVLEERYARGEISRDEYLQKRRDILG
jgi:putative membrane protein